MCVTIPGALRSRALRLPLLALALMALSGLPLAACGASVTHKPASQLRLEITLYQSQDEFPGELPDTASHFSMGAGLYDGATGRFVVPPTGAHFTCNGVAVPQCPRQSPGGSYQITYTDEHGAATTVNVPVPQGDFAILSPHSGGTATIPTDGLLTIHFATPLFPAGWTAAIDRVSASCSAQAQTWQCAVEADPQRQATGNANAAWVASAATPTPPATLTPPIASPTPVGGTATPEATYTPSSVTVTINGSESTALLRGDFSHWVPGPDGRIALFQRAEGKLEPSGFQSVTVRIADTHIIPVTWVR